MPQVFNVLRCFKCLVFQVHQCKKSFKWACKMCGEKQSIKRNYGISTAKECRGHVQRLNKIRGDMNDIDIDRDDDENVEQTNLQVHAQNTLSQNESKWTGYLDNTEQTTKNEEDSMYFDGKEVVLEVPKKMSRNKYGKRSYSSKKNWKSKHMNDSSDVEDGDENKDIELNREVKCEEIRLPVRNKIKFKPPVSKCNTHWDSYTEEIDNADESISNDTKDFKSDKNCVSNIVNTNNVKQQKDISNFVPSIVRDSSKWAQYIDEDNPDNFEETFNVSRENNKDVNEFDRDFENTPDTIETTKTSHNITEPSSKGNLQSLFSLCDDKELDDVLNF